MGELKKKLESEMIRAVKSKDKLRLSTIRMVRSSIKNKEIDSKRELEESEIISLISTRIKQGNDSIKMFNDGGRKELALKEASEIEILREFLPPQLLPEELKALIGEAIQKIGASSMKDIGNVMKAVMPLVSGRAQGKDVNIIVRELLT